MNKKVFILGGSGFVGSGISRFCVKRGIAHEIIGRENYKNYIGEKCDIFINAAGSSRRYLAEKQPDKDFDLSVISVFKSLLDFQFDTYVQISSVSVYTSTDDHAQNHESAVLNTDLQSRYGFHKYLAELIVRHYCSSWLILRVGGVVGLNMKKNQIYDIICNQPLRVDSRSMYQFINTEAVGRCLFQLMEKGCVNDIFNICGKGTISLEQVQQATGNVSASKGLPKEIWDINTSKADTILSIPTTAETLEHFLSQTLEKKIKKN